MQAALSERKIKANILRSNRNKIIDLNQGSTVNILLDKLNMKPDTVIVMKDNSPIPIDKELNDQDELTIVLVSSGG